MSSGSTTGSEQSSQLMVVFERVNNILVAPTGEWGTIKAESTSVVDIYASYVAPLAAIGPIAAFVGSSFIGMPGLGRTPIMNGLFAALVAYAFALGGVFVMSLILSGLNLLLGDKSEHLQFFRIVAYAYIPAWIAGILFISPALGIVGYILGFYSIYLLYMGFQLVMEAPEWKAALYSVVVVFCALVIGVAGERVGSSAFRGRASEPRQVQQQQEQQQQQPAPSAAPARKTREAPRQAPAELSTEARNEMRREASRAAPREAPPQQSSELRNEMRRESSRATQIVPAISPGMRAH